MLEPVAADVDDRTADVLAELAREDFLTTDQQVRIQAAYPFSAVATPHRVTLAGGARVWAMCAIDAVGVPAMLDVDAVISSVNPVTGESVSVTSENEQMVWAPASAVVFVGRRGCSGPAAEVCGDTLHFSAGAASAETWIEQHPEVTGTVVDQARAEEIGKRTLGPLLQAN
ncbi:alkylmercury lyase family protein [Streptomyces sp. NPDC059118]|uniref:alkylmercury lyase family protein n=1 Tax=unclassified Streptomyces TaxID=2593676 RepID=UPI0036A1E6FB